MLYIAKNVADRDMPCWFSYLSKNDNNKKKTAGIHNRQALLIKLPCLVCINIR